MGGAPWGVSAPIIDATGGIAPPITSPLEAERTLIETLERAWIGVSRLIMAARAPSRRAVVSVLVSHGASRPRVPSLARNRARSRGRNQLRDTIRRGANP